MLSGLQAVSLGAYVVGKRGSVCSSFYESVIRAVTSNAYILQLAAANLWWFLPPPLFGLY